MTTDARGRRRVVVTGVGALTPLGNDAETFWDNLVAGESGAAEISHFDATPFPVDFACEVKGFDPRTWIDAKRARRMDRFAQMVVAAARMAELDAKLDIAAEREQTGVAVATGIGGLRSFQECHTTILERGPERANPFSIPSILPNMGAAWISMELGTQGPLMSQCTACAAANMALGDALDSIRLGRSEVMLAGGTEAGIAEVGIAGFSAMRALSRRNDDPKRASRPFDLERDGFVMGEAAAIIVLESLEHALARDAKIYAELTGYGLSSDAHHMTEPDPTGLQPARAIANAMADAGVGPADVDHVNAHATSTPVGDSSETRILKRAFGEERAYEIPISAIKGATGHCLGASGAIEAIAAIFAVQRDVLPPTINLEHPDPECDLDYVPNTSRAHETNVAISHNFGFGGHNAALVFRKYE
jgi:3-oxoacyl-[acyl-carrier-protein] synthase II